jgi:hypothetical protein
MEDPQDARLPPRGALPGRNALTIQSAGDTTGGQPFGINPFKYVPDDPSLLRFHAEAAGLAVYSIHSPVLVAIRRVRAEVLFPALDLMPAAPSSAVANQFALELGEAPENVDHQVGHWACFRWELPFGARQK